jgi:hypothetical protein
MRCAFPHRKTAAGLLRSIFSSPSRLFLGGSAFALVDKSALKISHFEPVINLG